MWDSTRIIESPSCFELQAQIEESMYSLSMSLDSYLSMQSPRPKVLIIESRFSSPCPQSFRVHSGWRLCTISQASMRLSKFFCSPYRPEAITLCTSRLAASVGSNVLALVIQIELLTPHVGRSSWVKVTRRSNLLTICRSIQLWSFPKNPFLEKIQVYLAPWASRIFELPSLMNGRI